MSYHNPEYYRTVAFLYGKEHGVLSYLHLAANLSIRGYLDQGITCADQALAIAKALDHPHVLAYTLHAVSIYHLWRRESQTALDLAERSAARQQQARFWELREARSLLAELKAAQLRLHRGRNQDHPHALPE